MEAYEREYHDDSSDFDDRMELEDDYFFEIDDESEPFKEVDSFYRQLEEY